MSAGGAALAHWAVREKGPWRQVQGVSSGQAAPAHCSPGCEFFGDPSSLEQACLWGKNGIGLLPGGRAPALTYST